MGQHRSPVLVTGGTGTLGRLVVPRLLEAGCELRLLSRRHRDDGTGDLTTGVEYVTGDLTTGDGIEAAVTGTPVIVHLAGTAKGDDVKARNLIAAAATAKVRHLVYISVVGADRIPVVSAVDRAMFGYFRAKAGAERAIADSGLPWTTLRATQFYDAFAILGQQAAKMPVIPVFSGVRFQPVDTGEVAGRLAELTLGAPSGLVPDLAGPRVYPMAELFRGYLAARGQHRIMLPVRAPGQAARAVRAGANLALDRAVGLRTWEDFLADRVAQKR
jgi:uncharacterized protein YbjT (DUF2867 family)